MRSTSLFLTVFVLFLGLISCSQNDSEYHGIVDPGFNNPEPPIGGETPPNPPSNPDSPEEQPPGQPGDDQTVVLFMGNSLTYFNELPELVKREAVKYGVDMYPIMEAYPSYALEDHWYVGEVQKLLEKGNIDYLVIQQGPSSQPYGRETLFAYGALYKDICDNYDTQLAYFQVWPSRLYYDTFSGVIANYRDAALANDAILCPVGKVWKEHFDTTMDFSYYGRDGFHPSLRGSQSAAAIIAESLFKP